jgi:prephenate dehydratase
VHQNLYLLRDNDLKILAEYYLPINHCLASLENDLSEVKVAYSHPQALMQCENFLKENNIIPKPFSDTA